MAHLDKAQSVGDTTAEAALARCRNGWDDIDDDDSVINNLMLPYVEQWPASLETMRRITSAVHLFVQKRALAWVETERSLLATMYPVDFEDWIEGQARDMEKIKKMPKNKKHTDIDPQALELVKVVAALQVASPPFELQNAMDIAQSASDHGRKYVGVAGILSNIVIKVSRGVEGDALVNACKNCVNSLHERQMWVPSPIIGKNIPASLKIELLLKIGRTAQQAGTDILAPPQCDQW